jgi:serine/threonine protein kinase
MRKDRKINGTLGYLAPELMDGNNLHINNLNDVYSLGVCCFEMCFGKLPYVKNMGKLDTIGKFIS